MTGRGVWVKICGITTVDDALACVDAGADALGINLIAASPRRVDEQVARSIVRAVGAHAEVIGIVADQSIEAMRALRADIGLSALQLHGDERPETLAALLPAAYKAVRIGGHDDVTQSARYAGGRILVDAKVQGALGGTGTTFDWALVDALTRQRKVVLAGGLTPANVEAAVCAVRPYGVDTASGVERAGRPREKDMARVRAFISRAKQT